MLEIALISSIASLLGVNARELYLKYKSIITTDAKHEKEAKLANVYQHNQSILKAGLHHKVLCELYPDHQLEKVNLKRLNIQLNGKQIETAVVGFPNYLKAEIDITNCNENHSLVKLEKRIKLDEEFVSQILADIEFRGLNVWDQSIYRLNKIRLNKENIEAEFTLDRFMNYRLSNGALWDELMQAFIDTQPDYQKVISEYESRLPIRQKYLPDVESIAEYPSRMCAGGIHAIMAIKRPLPDDDFIIPIQRRNPRISEGQSAISCIPQAFHQPMIDPNKELVFSHTFYRELYEELFGGEEVCKETKRLRHDWFVEESEPLKWLKDNQDDYRLICTGAGFNLANGNYEISMLCIIKSSQFWKKYGHLMITSWESTVETIPLLSTKNSMVLKKYLEKPDWLGTGLYSLTRALDYLKKHEKCYDIPDFEVSP